MFVEERLLDCVSYGTAGGPTWFTRRVGLNSGIVRRNPRRSRPLHRYTIVYRNLLAEDHAGVLAAFNACMGGVFSFRLKDWSDYQGAGELIGIGTGAEQTVQLSKLYTFGTRTVARPIRKPVDGTIQLTADNVPIASTVDPETGMATFTAPVGDIVRWSGEFDVPVYFRDDELEFEVVDKNQVAGFYLTADVGLEEDLDA